MSPWFGATAALSEFKLRWAIDDATAGLLTVMVQFGFLVGALASAFLGVADVVPPRRLFFGGGVSAAIVNLLLLVPSLSFGVACLLRFLTGVAMAFIGFWSRGLECGITCSLVPSFVNTRMSQTSGSISTGPFM